jgi:carbamoyl-phosphate synthase large subunit
VLIDRYLRDATEVDVDAICDGTDVAVCGVLQHIEEAGVHSGDSACAIPPHSLKPDIIREIERQTRELALALKVRGLMNVQFAVKDDEVYLIEVNPRASRTVLRRQGGRTDREDGGACDVGRSLSALGDIARIDNYIAVKGRSFHRPVPGNRPSAWTEMKSTGKSWELIENSTSPSPRPCSGWDGPTAGRQRSFR